MVAKLSPALKALIQAPYARPGPTPAPRRIAEVYRAIARDAAQHNVGRRPWITFAAATVITLNSPDALLALHRVVTTRGGELALEAEGAGAGPDGEVAMTTSKDADTTPEDPVAMAELIREVGLKCIGFNGIPRTINMLMAFRAGLPADVVAKLATEPTRVPDAVTVPAVAARGRALWQSVYAGVDVVLEQRLALAHPDLPVHILGSHYGPLFSDPPGHGRGGLANVGRALTSLVGIACLRAQTGVGPQVVSHIFGLRKAIADGSWLPAAGEDANVAAASVRGVDWLATDAGSTWLLGSIDRMVAALGGSNFAGGSGDGTGEALLTAKL